LRHTIFFATDLHGSDVCFKKFVRGPDIYKAHLSILGGDLTGKALVKIRREHDGVFRSISQFGQLESVERSEVERFQKTLADCGVYSLITTATPLPVGGEDSADSAFQHLVVERMQRWQSMVEHSEAQRRIYWMPGNDDPRYIDDVWAESSVFLNIDNRVLTVADNLQILGFAPSTRTPWATPREMDENDIEAALATLGRQLDQNLPTICSIHVPPVASGLDEAPALDAQLRPRYEVGGLLTNAVGSFAVRQFIEETQPTLVLCGHVHESRGFVRIGRTLCINPGSNSSSGRLQGALVTIDEGSIHDFLLTEG